MTKLEHAIILAAGRGLRMMPFTDEFPKPMAPYQGSTLIAKGIAKLTQRLSRIYVTVGYKGALLAQHVIECGATAIFNTDGRPSSWWIYNTLLKHLNEPMYVLTCDNVVELDFDLLEDDYQRLGEPACMLVPVKPVPGLEGDYIFHEDHVVAEVNRHNVSNIYCSGIQILNPYRINALTQDLGDFYAVWNQLIAQRQLLVSSVFPKKWFAIDTVEQLGSLT